MTDLERMVLLFNDLGVPCPPSEPYGLLNQKGIARDQAVEINKALRNRPGRILYIQGTLFLFDADGKYVGNICDESGGFSPRREMR